MPRAVLLAATSALPGVELAGLDSKNLAHGADQGQANVGIGIGIDIDLAHTALDAALDFFDRHAVGLLDVATKLPNDLQPLLRRAAGAVHDQMGVGNLRVNGHDAFELGIAYAVGL
jgi:hypothetical protein